MKTAIQVKSLTFLLVVKVTLSSDMKYCVEYKHKLLAQNSRTFQIFVMGIHMVAGWNIDSVSIVSAVLIIMRFHVIWPDKERVESNMKSLNDSVFCLWCLVANKLDIHEQTSMFCFFQFVKS